jgi:transcriptional regulator with XRE-family HTH domain
MAVSQPNRKHPWPRARATRPGVRPPTLGDYLRATRCEHSLSRDQLAGAAAVSTSYIAQLETGEKLRPTVAALHALATALELGPDERRHLYDLARVGSNARPDDEPSDAEQLGNAITPEMLTLIDNLNPTLSAYLDHRWNIISANEAYARAFPGLIESGNVLRWLFTDPCARRILAEWEREAALTVRWLRANMGEHADDPAGTELLDELSAIPEFARMWLQGRVGFGRGTPYMRLRDPDTGEGYTLNVQLHSVRTPARSPLLIFIGAPIRDPAGD